MNYTTEMKKETLERVEELRVEGYNEEEIITIIKGELENFDGRTKENEEYDGTDVQSIIMEDIAEQTDNRVNFLTEKAFQWSDGSYYWSYATNFSLFETVNDPTKFNIMFDLVIVDTDGNKHESKKWLNYFGMFGNEITKFCSMVRAFYNDKSLTTGQCVGKLLNKELAEDGETLAAKPEGSFGLWTKAKLTRNNGFFFDFQKVNPNKAVEVKANNLKSNLRLLG